MKINGTWEQIYLHCVAIHDIDTNCDNSIRDLCAHLSTIDLLIPEGVEPDSDFELYVVAKLCRHIEELLICRMKHSGL